ncbi:hypothetical protein BU23DRAFT_11402 [Bimuria novae-zelandiae CBS 107.79]|uniref:NAD(P)-binding protein n=1 Tax=Bimuria novae-zelandiae CBS 107.79 TaxID=1447943 RepID=A0A6A5VJ98_9PLEO|nr:hypothetical protein BU23DRAFT_11402 [Bimuria novae-zelandiae CBS 107.79]
MLKTVLITGANRGLGLGLLKHYLLLPSHTMIAAVRSPSHPTSVALKVLPTAADTRLIIVKIDAAVHADAFSAVQELKEKYGVKKLDVVIANAGVSYVWPAIKDVKIEDMEGHMRPNVYGVVSLFQATRALLEQSAKEGTEPTFALMGSIAGCLVDQPSVPNAAYGPSKAAAQWLIVRMHTEETWLNAINLDPGWVQTDLGQAGAKGLGFETAPTTVEESCNGMMVRLGETSRAAHGGKYVHWFGGEDEWKGCEHKQW